MKKLFILGLLAIGLVSASVCSAADTNSLFSGNEASVNVSTAYQLDGAYKLNGAYSENVAVGAGYYATKYVGIEASLPFYNTQGVAVKDVLADVLVRVPVTVGSHFGFAPYGGVGVDYAWNQTQFSPFAKAGVELRVNKGWALFTEYQYTIDRFADYQNGAGSLRGGLRLNF